LKGALNEYDLLLIDSRLNIQRAAKDLGGGMQILMRKKKFPFPVKIHGSNFIKNIKESIKGSHFLLGGGKDFTCQCARTESLSVKDSVKNVMQSVFKIVCLVLFAQERNLKHNFIEEISLQTTKSICLPIYEK
jgi:hypothetical protein